MSGFEVIGVLLGVYPVVIDGLKLCKAVSAGHDIKLLVNDLMNEDIRYNQYLEYLFGTDFVEKEQERLKGGNTQCSRAAPQQMTNLERRFGKKKADLIFSTLEDMRRVLESMNRDIEKAKAGNVLDVGYYAKASTTFRTIRLIRKKSSFRERLLQLRNLNDRLKLHLEGQPLPSTTRSWRKSLPNIRLLRQERYDNVVNIYYAIHKGYQCQCEVAHLARLRLPELPRSVDDQLLADDSSNSFNLLFAIEDSPEIDTASVITVQTSQDGGTDDAEHAGDEIAQEDIGTTARVMLNAGNLNDLASRRLSLISSTATMTTTSTNTSSRSKTSKSRSLLIKECSGADPGPIEDLCATVKGLNRSEMERIGILSSNDKRYELRRVMTPQDLDDFGDTIDLDDWLRNDQDAMTGSRRFRIGLALRLSYAVLQFFSTPWIDKKWSWKDFSISMNADGRKSDSQLYITHNFYSSHCQISKSNTEATMSFVFWLGVGEETLTRLGFALIELGLGRRLSELREDGSIQPRSEMAMIKDGDILDYWTAEDVLESRLLYNEQCEDYEEVVRVLIRHEFIENCEQKSLNSRKPSFHKDVENLVISPLFCMWTETWGKRPSQLSF